MKSKLVLSALLAMLSLSSFASTEVGEQLETDCPKVHTDYQSGKGQPDDVREDSSSGSSAIRR